MKSAYDKREVLIGMMDAGATLTPAEQRALLETVVSVNGDYDRREVLVRFLKQYTVEGATREPFFAAVRALKSAYDRRVVLTALADKGALPRDIVQSAIESASIASEYDRAEILLALVRSQSIDGTTKQSLITAAETLRSQYDQDRVLAAITRAERR